MKVFSILISGVGGQGVLMAGGVIAQAALLSGLDVKQSDIHGMAQRGGSVTSHIRFGEEVFSPTISAGGCDLIVGFEPLEAARALHYLKPDGIVVSNTHRIITLTVA